MDLSEIVHSLQQQEGPNMPGICFPAQILIWMRSLLVYFSATNVPVYGVTDKKAGPFPKEFLVSDR